ncbi:MAG: hypothetical protein ACU0CI_14045 [Shimia sp.]
MSAHPSDADIDRVFQDMRRLGRALSKEIALSLQLSLRTVNPSLTVLVKMGKLHRTMTPNGWFYRLASLADLSDVDKGLLQTREGAAWTAMRRFTSFSVKDLQLLMAGTGFEGHERFVETYVRGLVAGGVVALRANAKRGRPATYQVVKDVGPLPPQRKSVVLTYDPNAGVYVDAELVLT